MKKGFTMIELIFVIVILGILAAVAIPRLAATRDDAEVAKVATNMSTLVSDIGSYYTSQGKLASTLEGMTNVAVPGLTIPTTAGGTGTGNISVAGTDCFSVTITTAKTPTAGDYSVDSIKFANIDGAADKKNACKMAQKDSQITKLVGAKFDAPKYKQVGTELVLDSDDTEEVPGFPLTGLRVVR